MKALLTTCIFLYWVLIISACKKDAPADEPIAIRFDFEVTGLSVIFANTSVNAQNYLWNFGDGTTSVEESPQHTYSAAGIYQVQLRGTAANGDQLSTKAAVTVN